MQVCSWLYSPESLLVGIRSLPLPWPFGSSQVQLSWLPLQLLLDYAEHYCTLQLCRLGIENTECYLIDLPTFGNWNFDVTNVSNFQAALPQGIVPFVFAKEYNVHPDILSTGFALKPFLPFLSYICQAIVNTFIPMHASVVILYASVISLFHVSIASFDAWFSFVRVSCGMPPM